MLLDKLELLEGVSIEFSMIRFLLQGYVAAILGVSSKVSSLLARFGDEQKNSSSSC